MTSEVTFAAAGVAVEDLGRYCAGEPQAGLVIGFGAIPLDRIADGLRRLADSSRG